VKSIPAMPPIGPSHDAEDYAHRVARALTLAPFYAHWAVFAAQGLMRLDGQRRRVYKHGAGDWRIELAAPMGPEEIARAGRVSVNDGWRTWGTP